MSILWTSYINSELTNHFRLAARVLLYASSHRQDNTYHGLCYTSDGALAGMRNGSMGPPWRIDPTTNRTLSERSYHGPVSIWSQVTFRQPKQPFASYSQAWIYITLICYQMLSLKCFIANLYENESFDKSNYCFRIWETSTSFLCKNSRDLTILAVWTWQREQSPLVTWRCCWLISVDNSTTTWQPDTKWWTCMQFIHSFIHYFILLLIIYFFNICFYIFFFIIAPLDESHLVDLLSTSHSSQCPTTHVIKAIIVFNFWNV